MVLHEHFPRGALLVTLALALAACTKQPEEQPPASESPAAASAPAFPTGNAKSLALTDCETLPNPKPVDNTPTAQADAMRQGLAARAACKNDVHANTSNEDLARIRQIKENKESERAGNKVSEAEWRKGLKEGSKAPLKDYKY